MSIARSVADVLRDHVVLELEAIDRMYLNVYVPHLQTVGAVVGYLRVHHGQRFASTSAVVPMTEAFIRKIEQFVNDEGVDLVAFEKNQRKDNVTRKYLRGFRKTEGVLYVGRAQEKARVMRTERRRNRRTGATYPWIVESTAMVNHLFLLRRRELRPVLPEVLFLLSLHCQALHQRSRISQTTACQVGSGIRGARQRYQVLCGSGAYAAPRRWIVDRED